MPKAITTIELEEAINSLNAPLVIDVRRQPVFETSERMIAGASWRNPEEIETWLSGLNRNRDVVVYCVHGHQVSQNSAARLEQEGFRATYLDGGFEHWAAEGRQTAPRL